MAISKNVLSPISYKRNNVPLYNNSSSSHPLQIIKQLPNIINKRISDLTYDQMEFGNVKAMYEFALRREESGTRELNSPSRVPRLYSKNILRQNPKAILQDGLEVFPSKPQVQKDI